MLLGEYDHTLDDKNRLTLPARFRQAFAEGIVVTRGMDGCLFAYTREAWESMVGSRLATLNTLSKEGRRMQRFFFSGATETELDKQGRFGLPAALLEHAKLGRDVVVAGVHDHLEIWDRAAWRRELAEVEGSAEHVAERLAAQRD
ncbi:MAG TPA: division/cell wall cluster transcriptional repressor MraZ [Gaiellaceae bacterium]|jgi:MraZ protein|nr:division/cell wall cluster transcriptional repressor MraZ [Gaiellaceae bacterium]